MGTARYVPHHDVLDLDTVGHFIVGLVDIFREADTMGRRGSRKAGRRVRRQFTEECKAGAVRLVLDEERTVGAVARELDLTPSALAGWVRAGQAARPQGTSGLMQEDREAWVRRRTELRLVQEARDILNKAAAYFATQSR